MDVFKLPEDVPLEHPMVSRALEQAQVKVEGFHFDNRKHLVDYDDVLNKHREIVYPVSYTHLRAHETVLDLVCRLLLEKNKQNTEKHKNKKQHNNTSTNKSTYENYIKNIYTSL